uniref:Retrotransposon gag domain-containing protein n=1 Tax=Eptatretus burgeri TaxID=7764 RepID=A0A8C4NLR4_EPTBU
MSALAHLHHDTTFGDESVQIGVCRVVGLLGLTCSFGRGDWIAAASNSAHLARFEVYTGRGSWRSASRVSHAARTGFRARRLAVTDGSSMAEGQGTVHGRVPIFIGDDFELFSEQLGCYFNANDVDDESKRKSILLASLSTEHYRLLSDLVAPDKPGDDGLSFQDIVEKMKAHMSPEKSLQLARYQFDHLAKGAEERVADFVARVKHSAVACKFTAEERPARLRDRFISGLQDAKMVAAILRMRSVDVTFDSAVGTASAVEQTLTDVRAIAGQDVMGSSGWGMSADPGVHAMTQVPQR